MHGFHYWCWPWSAKMRKALVSTGATLFSHQLYPLVPGTASFAAGTVPLMSAFQQAVVRAPSPLTKATMTTVTRQLTLMTRRRLN